MFRGQLQANIGRAAIFASRPNATVKLYVRTKAIIALSDNATKVVKNRINPAKIMTRKNLSLFLVKTSMVKDRNFDDLV